MIINEQEEQICKGTLADLMKQGWWKNDLIHLRYAAWVARNKLREANKTGN